MNSVTIYDVTIQKENNKNYFNVTWQHLKEETKSSFITHFHLFGEKKLELWERAEFQLEIGHILFNFLDGENKLFQKALKIAEQKSEALLINLYPCKEMNNIPFELLAYKGRFLLLNKIHLIRRVSSRGCKKKGYPQNRPLKILLMACSPKNEITIAPNFIQEEEAILETIENLPGDIDISSYSSLEGLKQKLLNSSYDVIYLIGHAYIEHFGQPFFQMENEFSGKERVYSDNLWNDALIENAPRFLLLSGCRTGEAKGYKENKPYISFAYQMVKNYYIPAVLGWGSKVRDIAAIHAGKFIVQQLSRGCTIPDAIQRARHELDREFPEQDNPSWPLLRLYCDGTSLNTPIVKNEQLLNPKSRQLPQVCLENNQIKILKKGFIGRDFQLRVSVNAIEIDKEKVGVLILGLGGLGKTCLAGKICERLQNSSLIILKGKLDDFTLGMALKKTFLKNQDQNGLKILKSQKMEMSEKIKTLCSSSFQKKKYIILLDSFQENIEFSEYRQPGFLNSNAASLLYTLLCDLPFSLKQSQLIITSRYPFILTHSHHTNFVQKQLQFIWLNSLNSFEQEKKLKYLKNVGNSEDNELKKIIIEMGSGNPQLMEQLDDLLGQLPVKKKVIFQIESRNIRKKFIQHLDLKDIYDQVNIDLKKFLKELISYKNLFSEVQIPHIEEKTKTKNGKELLQKAIHLGLVEYNQEQTAFIVAPLLRDIIK